MPTESTTTAKTIELLRDKFAAFGIPVELVSDNGPQFSQLGNLRTFAEPMGSNIP